MGPILTCLSNTAIALNNTFDFVDNFPPPSNMVGAALMPGGFLLGFQGRNLLMTEPYLPHAWNPTYNLATEFEIVGIVIWSQTAIICTTSNLYLGSGSYIRMPSHCRNWTALLPVCRAGGLSPQSVEPIFRRWMALRCSM